MGSTVEQAWSHLNEQAWSHLNEQAGYTGKRGRHDDKTCVTRSSGQIGRNDGLLIPPVRKSGLLEQCAELLEPETHNNGKITDLHEDNEELEHDVHSFVDKTTHLTSAVLRRVVEISML